jgi:hypothetical protein
VKHISTINVDKIIMLRCSAAFCCTGSVTDLDFYRSHRYVSTDPALSNWDGPTRREALMISDNSWRNSLFCDKSVVAIFTLTVK